MHLFNIVAILITLAALLSFINHRFIKLPVTIGLLLSSFLISLGIIILGQFYPSFVVSAQDFLKTIDFNKTLLEGMLSFLLFAGALHINLNDLKKEKWIISILATLGVVFNTFLIGSIMFYVFSWFGFQVPYIYCLLFGSLISPTDPIAVLGILKQAKAPKTLETKIAGESLFNDGVGVVVFIVILTLIKDGGAIQVDQIAILFAEEAGGGVLLGLLLGYITNRMMKTVDNYQVEILLTLALTCGGYALASAIHTSGPIAIVVAGLLVGNHGREHAMSDETQANLDKFWELVDEILNAVLFVLIGLEVLVLDYQTGYVGAGLVAIPVALGSRFISISIPVKFLDRFRDFSKGAIQIMTWAGLRGGISVALALAIPAGPERALLLTVTYVVVVFSILVQGLTTKRLILFYR